MKNFFFFFLLNVFNLQVIASEEEKSALVLFYEIPLPRPRDLLRRKRFFQVVCCRACRGLSCGATINKYLCFFFFFIAPREAACSAAATPPS